jgi:uncharacterized protein (DUF58 family)
MRHIMPVSWLIFALIIGGFYTLNGPLLLMVFPFVLYIVIGLLTAPDELQLHITRTLTPDRVPEEAPVTVTITITNHGHSLDELHLCDDIPAGLTLAAGDKHEWLMSLAAGATVTLTYTITAPRGAYRFRAFRATARDRFGLIHRRATIPVESNFFSYKIPNRNALKHIDIRPRRTRVYSGTIAAYAGGEGTDFFSVRNYQSGDAWRRINWKASARQRDSLFTNEFEQERVADVGLILDARTVSNLPHGPQSILEYSVEATTALADAFISQGNRVALLVYGDTPDYTLPGYGKVQREKIMHALARVRLGDSQVFAELRALPTQLFPAKSQIVIISPLLEEDVPFLKRLRSFGYQVMLISPNPVRYEKAVLGQTPGVSFAARMAQVERRLLLQQLLQAGVFVLDWLIDQPFDEVASAHLRTTFLKTGL